LKCLVLEDLPASADSHASPHQAQPSDAVAFMLTSGSTGKPKAVVLRHSNFIASCAGKAKHHGTSSETPFLNWIAFDHVASLSEIHIHALLVDAP
jgi:acyl-CoA synthetase (AMP-forming)/AMP-acid ligase II